ncbi:S-methyl-5-thioribose-1-phosphate isomerase [Syntrophomonas palmitatica]|uniref:S-methyl-5-thioribose-1-phosphate isomerase n=1 Tax=Syntrophomonas palmitatica TaxID=402877 RepID=UPI003F7273F3
MRTLYYEEPVLFLLDQNRLPQEIKYVECHTADEVAAAIKNMAVRGAPLIGVSAAFGLFLAVKSYTGSASGLRDYYQEKRKLLASTRPTAVNLFWALKRMDKVFASQGQSDKEKLEAVLLKEAYIMLQEDIEVNRAIGENGRGLLNDNCRIMTICNAGALATCGYGTALGVVRSAARYGKLQLVWACETRPVLQGARLTIWELMHDQIPVRLITDNMAGFVMQKGLVDAVIVGADRIAGNGDTANKIGTYSLAVLASYHGLPFYVAAPYSSIDVGIGSGKEIPIEERDPNEVRQFRGTYSTVAEVDVYNPAFDITPHQLIAGIITEKGVIKPPFAGRL